MRFQSTRGKSFKVLLKQSLKDRTLGERGSLFSPRNLSRSLPTNPHSPHACSTLGVYTFSVTWTVLRLLTSLALGYSNRPDWKSPSSVAATRFLPGVLSFLYTLSLLERVLLHWPTSHMQSSTAWPTQSTGKTDTAFLQAQQWTNGSRSRLWDRDPAHKLNLR
jgi:hypothetical protein